jgi:hypothetical protein
LRARKVALKAHHFGVARTALALTRAQVVAQAFEFLAQGCPFPRVLALFAFKLALQGRRFLTRAIGLAHPARFGGSVLVVGGFALAQHRRQAFGR